MEIEGCMLRLYFFSSTRRHTRWTGDWSSDVCSSDLKPAEAAKVQPKKETVRINLPPKPTAAPTIKLPAPAPAAPAAAPVAAAPAPAPAHAPAPPTPAPRPAAAPTATARPAAPQRRAPVMTGVIGLDKALALAAALIAVLVLVRVLML